MDLVQEDNGSRTEVAGNRIKRVPMAYEGLHRKNAGKKSQHGVGLPDQRSEAQSRASFAEKRLSDKAAKSALRQLLVGQLRGVEPDRRLFSRN